MSFARGTLSDAQRKKIVCDELDIYGGYKRKILTNEKGGK